MFIIEIAAVIAAFGIGAAFGASSRKSRAGESPCARGKHFWAPVEHDQVNGVQTRCCIECNFKQTYDPAMLEWG
ncbi:hypothetical protein GS982_01805 [Rhodococcus hoagii]|uniref:Uncharacterized protein n=1 Tax=Rhodococcus hoagii TaxID=43767 RepID=A0A9Q4ZIU7_RHOHA|nr:hypothetical protein [Prescottella equi]NKT77335.1 hypothetical protein [Prescottella equi]NKZ81120.1 hypothetical protein [Prescottella equi]